MAMAYRSYADVITENLHMQIHENIHNHTSVLRKRANDGKEFAIAVDNIGLASSHDPQGIYYNAAQQLQNAVNQHNSQLQSQLAQNQQLGQMYMAQQQAMNQMGYLNQLAQAHPIVAKAAKEAEEIEEEVVKEVYKAAFEWRRFIERVMHWPIDFIDWSVRWA